MARGRPAKPVEEHKRDGTVPTGGARPPVQLGGRERPDTPPGLDADTRKVWDVVVDDLTAGNVLDRADWAAVEAFSISVARARQARRAIAFEQKRAAEQRRKAPELLAKYEADMERWRDGELKYEPREPDVDMNPHSHLTQAGQKGARIPNAYLGVERESWREARQLGENLGLSPSARARLGLNVKGAGRRQGADAGRQGIPDSPRGARGGLGVVEGGRK